MSRPRILDTPTQAMLAAIRDTEVPKIISTLVVASLSEGISSFSMHIELNTLWTPATERGLALFYQGMRIAPMPYAGFRKIHATDNPIIHRLMQMEGKVPGDLALLFADVRAHHAFHAWAIRDLGVSPLAVVGAL